MFVAFTVFAVIDIFVRPPYWKLYSEEEHLARVTKLVEKRYIEKKYSQTQLGYDSSYDYITDYSIYPLYDENDEISFFAESSLITLADGSQKAVEQLTGDEMLLVWNMFTGTFDAAPILFIDHDPAKEYEVINLLFSDGTSVKVISEHAFWNFDLNKHVFLRADAAKYIGHWFNKQYIAENGEMSWRKVQLADVSLSTELTTAWSPVTYRHLCYYVNGMLSMPGKTEDLINIFDVNETTMSYNAETFETDIATYSLFTYEEFAEFLPISKFVFDAFGGQYLKVAIGKGLTSIDALTALFEAYEDLL